MAQTQRDFRKLLLALPDLKADMPDAAEQVAVFVSRSTTKDAL